ncbi:MAG: single-stranded DNA-binding protein [Bacteroidales bacterium]|nr:single-stranded DNA-binding protein [Bacteroidales bacterium]MBQ9597257.1 single-stranded DNA-binding protein [Bacteroidales bacterium]MCR4565755.1 single-stranded DNA-binding protein [Bacteroidales bacterium]
MEQLNRIDLRGVVGKAQIRTVGERKVANFSLATSRAYGKRDGSSVMETEWHNVVAWEGGMITDLSFINKGAKLFVTGRMTYRKWTGNDGQDHYDSEVIAAKVEPINESLSSQIL